MLPEEYEYTIGEITSDEIEINLSDELIALFSKRANELEKEFDFTQDDVVEELEQLVPKEFKDEKEWNYFIEELASIVMDEMVTEEYDELEDLEKSNERD